MTILPSLPSSPARGLALAVLLALCAGTGAASAAQLEGGTIGQPLSSSSTAPTPPTRTPAPPDVRGDRDSRGGGAEHRPGTTPPRTPGTAASAASHRGR